MKYLQYFKKYLPLQLAFLLGLLVANVATIVYAHGGNTNFIHGCVKTGLLGNGNLRIVGANDNCNGNETALDWPRQSYAPGFEGTPMICGGCSFNESTFLVGKDLTDTWFIDSGFLSADLTNTSFTRSKLKNSSFTSAQLTNTNFTQSELENAFMDHVSATSVNFTQANLAGGNLSGSNFTNTNFTNANLTNTYINDNVVFTNPNFTNANLTGMHYDIPEFAPTITGALWSNTICPDGTNSNSHSNTCEGHF